MKTKFSGILTLLLAFVVQFTFAQEKTISGTVSDENGLPLPTATVIINGTTTGTSTDFDGNYSIIANEGDVLDFSYVGYATQSQPVGASNTIDVTLQPDNTLDEVVVTALGIKRKKDEITTVYQEVKTEELVKANNPNVVNGLAGKVSGLTITQNTNGVSGGTRVVLRGNRTISGNNTALVVIDGTISSYTFFNAIDPNQIESVNVIKGAAGSALYGSQGSNGVIVVTTKKGSGEKMTVEVFSSLDFETVDYVPERQTRYGQGWDLGNGFENIIYENGGWGPEFDGQMVPVGLPQADGSFVMAPFSTRGADHIKEFFKTGITRQNSFSVSAGDDEGYFRLGGRNVNTDFVIAGDQRKRNTFTLNAGKTLGKWSAAGSVIYTNSTVERHNGNMYTQLLQTASNIPIEQFANSGNEGHWNAYFTNPYWNVQNQRSKGENNNFSLTGDLGYSINDNISLKLVSNARIQEGNSLSYQNAYEEPANIVSETGANRSLISNFSFQNFRNSQYYTDFFVNLDYMLTDNISFNANLGLNNQYFKASNTVVGGVNLTVPGIYTTANLPDGPAPGSTGDSRSSSSRIGAFANLDFGYKDFLFVTLTGRNDWSSTLAKANQSFFYPSASLSFLPTKAFPSIKGDVLNYWKVTAAYVKIGNDGSTGAYAIQQLVNQAPIYPIGGENSFVVDRGITDPFLTPEFFTTYEFGMNFGLFKDRITLDASYSTFKGTDQINLVGASAASGIGLSRINIGETKGSALELDLGVKVIRTEDIQWDVNIGYSNSDNEVVKVSDQATEVALSTGGLAQSYAIEGQPFPVLQTAYYDRDDQGRVLIDAATGNPIQGTGIAIQGRTTPTDIVNLNTSFTYKNWSLQATMDYRTGHVFFSDTKSNMTWSGHAVETAQGGRGPFIFPNSAINTGTAENPVYEANTSVLSGGNQAGQYINWFGRYRNIGENHVLDATAFKVRELSLSYTLDAEALKHTFFENIRISATARNPFTVLPAENRGYGDPEGSFTTGNAQGITSIAQGNYPPTKTFGLGLNLTF